MQIGVHVHLLCEYTTCMCGRGCVWVLWGLEREWHYSPSQSCAGVRSLKFNSYILSMGTGAGHLYFYDLRAGSYLDIEASSHGSARVCSLKTSQGWLVCASPPRHFFFLNVFFCHHRDMTQCIGTFSQVTRSPPMPCTHTAIVQQGPRYLWLEDHYL